MDSEDPDACELEVMEIGHSTVRSAGSGARDSRKPPPGRKSHSTEPRRQSQREFDPETPPSPQKSSATPIISTVSEDSGSAVDQRQDCLVRFNWDPLLAEEEEQRRAQRTKKKIFSSQGTHRGHRVTVTLGERGIIWKQERRAGSGDPSNRSDPQQQQQRQMETLCYLYEDVISVTERPQPAGQTSRIVISVCQRYNSSQFRLLEKELDLPKRRDADRWVRYTERVLDSMKRRVRSAAMYVCTKAGKGAALGLMKDRVLPLLKKFDVKVTRVERPKPDELAACLMDCPTEELEDSVDALIIIGGDGTVQRMCDALLRRAQQQQHQPHDSQVLPAHLRVCIVPAGFNNDVARSLLGTVEPVSPVVHMLAGHVKKVNCVQVLARESGSSGDFKFLRWCFNASYGLPSSTLKYLEKYKLFYDSKYEKAMSRALDKKTFMAYPCDLQYRPSANAELSHPTDGTCCFSRCPVCQSVESSKHRRQSEGESDSVQEFDPLNSSNNSDSLIELVGRDAWLNLKGDYSWVGVYSLAGMSENCPQGLSRFAHRNDGCMDLVLVSEARKKEVARFVKSLGGSSAKSHHLELPFVESIRCTAIRFQPRSRTWNAPEQCDELELDAKSNLQRLRSAGQDSNSSEMVIDLLNDDSDSSDDALGDSPSPAGAMATSATNGRRRSSVLTGAGRRQSLANILCDSSDEDEEEAADAGAANGASQSEASSRAAATAADGDEKKPGSAKGADTDEPAKKPKKKKKSRLAKLLHTTPGPSCADPSYVAPTRLPSEIEQQRRIRKQMEKMNRRAMKEDAKLRSKWNLDFSLIDELELEFHCYANMLEIFCEGIFSDTAPRGVSASSKTSERSAD
ncbi:hypothetical protein BOX15_Mlig009606g2 [Macrostomum lignano]|uniref:DAGKc domain-containing protein n=2 Tax=Macrostomum lignano TaxID=282301 RepID=A0A1I8GUA6_9PLAT|nr:hypothetical protein BOX15_Mlig009606g2 [Macrostomum lignano]